MASKTFVPDESLQAIHQANQDAQFFKVPGTPQAQYEIPQEHYKYPEKRILGMRVATFWLSLALCLVIIASAVGGGVGGASAHAHSGGRWYVWGSFVCSLYFIDSDSLYSLGAGGTNVPATTVTTTVTTTSPSSTSTSGFTNFSVTAPSAITSLYIDCPAVSSTTYTAQNSSNIFAMTCDLDYPSWEVGNKDIVSIIAYSLQDCMEACSQMTSRGIASCAGALFESDLGEWLGGNCYLKSSLVTSSSGFGNTFAFGKLLHS
jgi:hypothetical protein